MLDLLSCVPTSADLGLDCASAYEPPRVKVLVVAADTTDAHAIIVAVRHMVPFEAQLTSTATIAAARFALRSDAFDLVIVGPGADGRPSTDVLAAAAECGAKAVIQLLHTPSRKEARSARAHGATDCIQMDQLSPARLQRVITASSPPCKVAGVKLGADAQMPGGARSTRRRKQPADPATTRIPSPVLEDCVA